MTPQPIPTIHQAETLTLEPHPLGNRTAPDMPFATLTAEYRYVPVSYLDPPEPEAEQVAQPYAATLDRAGVESLMRACAELLGVAAPSGLFTLAPVELDPDTGRPRRPSAADTYVALIEDDWTTVEAVTGFLASRRADASSPTLGAVLDRLEADDDRRQADGYGSLRAQFYAAPGDGSNFGLIGDFTVPASDAPWNLSVPEGSRSVVLTGYRPPARERTDADLLAEATRGILPGRQADYRDGVLASAYSEPLPRRTPGGRIQDGIGQAHDRLGGYADAVRGPSVADALAPGLATTADYVTPFPFAPAGDYARGANADTMRDNAISRDLGAERGDAEEIQRVEEDAAEAAAIESEARAELVDGPDLPEDIGPHEHLAHNPVTDRLETGGDEIEYADESDA